MLWSRLDMQTSPTWKILLDSMSERGFAKRFVEYQCLALYTHVKYTNRRNQRTVLMSSSCPETPTGS